MIVYVKITGSLNFHVVKKSVKIYSMVCSESDFKLSVAFLFLFLIFTKMGINP